jgi:hypothetical protein
MAGGHAAESIAGADLRDGAFVAINATIMAHLQEQRTIAESVAALDALGATNTKLLVDRVFVIRIFNVGPLNRGRWAQAVLSAGAQIIG